MFVEIFYKYLLLHTVGLSTAAIIRRTVGTVESHIGIPWLVTVNLSRLCLILQYKIKICTVIT